MTGAVCGIAGIVGAGPLDAGDRARADAALARIARRGPDGAGEWRDPAGSALLLHRRLAVQDLSDAAAQPMAAPGGRLRLVYNGEIYNAADLRAELAAAGRRFLTRGDTEVLLHALDEWGLGATLLRLRGMYAFVALESDADGAPRRVLAAVDHAGMKPLVYRFDAARPGGRGPRLAFASDADALIALLPDRPGLDPEGLCHVLSLGYCPAPATVWRGVAKLGPGRAMEWTVGDPAGPRVWRHWTPPEVVGGPAGPLTPLLSGVLADHLVGDVPLALLLSAGLDSSALAVLLHSMGAARRGPMPRAVTLSTDAPDDEASDAAGLARRLGMEHAVAPLGAAELETAIDDAAGAYDEPQGFTALLTAVRVARAVRAGGAKVALGGDGGDEALAGYAWHRDAPSHPLALGAFDGARDDRPDARRLAEPGADPRARLAAATGLGRLSYVHRYLRRTFGGFHPAEARALLAGLAPAYDEDAYAAWLRGEDRPALPHPRRAQRLDVLAFCAGSIQPKLDRACMAVGLELRAPFLDRRVLEHALPRPVDPRELDPRAAKPDLRALLAGAAERGLAPRALLERPKRGFSLRLADPGALDRLGPLVDRSAMVRDGVLRPDWAAYLTADPEDRRSRLFTLAMLARWYEARR